MKILWSLAILALSLLLIAAPCRSSTTEDTTTIEPESSTADTATSTADTATSTADTATSTADTATSTADTATSTSDTATSTADTATSTANTASPTADTATSTADTATSTADTATSTANTATSTANTATSTADTATSTVDPGKTADTSTARSSTLDPSTTTAGSSTLDPSTTTTSPSATATSPTTVSPPTLQPPVGYTVATAYGRFTGTTYTVVQFPAGHPFANTKRVSRFLGLPYAQPPTGSLRFKPPVKIQARNDSALNATELKPNCPQRGQSAPTEDCLYFNVWTVQTAENANASVRYPALIWIHGGRFEAGGSQDPLKQGEELVTHQDAVVVTFNYRLGALGFLTLAGTNYAGNYGIQDQRVAISVVYDILPPFGGNRSQVALMGLDAGAASVGFHLMDTATSGLFTRAVMMGGSPMMPWSLTNDIEYVQLLSRLFTSRLNCNVSEPAALATCLQEVGVGRLLQLQANFTGFFQGLEFSPVVDGAVIPADPWHAFSTGGFAAKDLLIGSTNDEGANIAEDRMEALGIPIHGANDSLLLDLIERSVVFYPRASRTLSAVGRQFLRLHFTKFAGVNDGRANFDTLVKAVGDWYLTCPVLQMARFANLKTPNVFLYYFTEKEISQDKWDGASHGEDANYAFGVPTLSAGISYPPDKKRLSERVMEHLVAFARDGAPAPAELWKPLNHTQEMNYINYNADARILGNYQRGYRLAECHFWNSTLAYVNGLAVPTPTTPAPTTPAPTTPAPTTRGTSTAATTTRNPIGPIGFNGTAFCDSWAVNNATATTLGVLLSTQVLMAGALAFFIYKWKSLTKIGTESVPMS